MGFAFDDREQLIIFGKEEGRWFANLSELTFIYDKNRDSLLSISKSVIEKTPKSGWKLLLDSLNRLKIMSLPDMSDIPNYELSTDGNGVTIEIASKNRYRVYSYQNPFYYQTKFVEAQNIVRIMELLEREFEFKRRGSI